MAEILPIVMPKWGLAMQEGLLAAWHVEAGAVLTKGQELCDIETSKIANVMESPVGGTLRRRLAEPGTTLPVGALLAVVADPAVPEAAIDAFVADFEARFAAAAATAAAEAPRPRTITADHRRIRLLELGTGGVPVVLVHGFGGDLDGWMFNQESLAERRRTIALDLPGHGGSSKEVGPGTVGFLAGELMAILAALGIDRAHLVGHSLGGAVSLDLALNHPEAAASLTLVASAALGPEINIDYIDGFLATSRARKLRPILEMLVHDPRLVTAEMVENVLKARRMDGAEAALNRIASACFAGGRQQLVLTHRLAELGVPAQVIWGAEDRILPVAHCRGLPAAIPVSVLAGAGHLVHMEKAAEVNALIERLVG